MAKKKRAAYSRIDWRDESKRLNRIIGQIEGVQNMLEEQRKLSDILNQCKAIHSALRSVEARLVSAHLEATLDKVVKLDSKKDRSKKVAELEELFRKAS